MKIIIDAFGGDNAPQAIIDGTIDAINDANGFTAVLVGKKDVITEILKNKQYDSSRIEIVDAEEIITNDESPVEAVRAKTKSSIVVGYNVLNTDPDAKAYISAGSTGAVLTGGVLLVKRIKGIQRPALSPILPTVTGGNVMLIDCGANTDPKPINLAQFAKMGSDYMKAVFGIASPRVALLSNGTEDKKGNEFHKEVFPLLKELDINFIGNMEGRDMLSGNIDVVVSDGFSGNIALKTCEGTALAMFDIIKQSIMEGGLRAKIGYLLLKPALKCVKKRMDYNEVGGACFLGLEKIVIKAHGSSKPKSIKAAIMQAKHLVDTNVIEKITSSAVDKPTNI